MSFPSITGFLDGSFPQKDEPSTAYVAELKNHLDYVKLGFCQLKSRGLRMSDPELGRLLWESCREEELVISCGDLTRSECWLFEQYLLVTLQEHREQVPELAEQKWPGYTETLRIPKSQRGDFIKFVSDQVNLLLTTGYDGMAEMLDQVVVSAGDRELYRELVRSWDAESETRRASINARRLKNGEDPLPSFYERIFAD